MKKVKKIEDACKEILNGITELDGNRDSKIFNLHSVSKITAKEVKILTDLLISNTTVTNLEMNGSKLFYSS